MPITDAEKARQVAVTELRRQLATYQAQRTEATLIHTGKHDRPTVICPFCGSSDVKAAADVTTHREIIRIKEYEHDDPSIIISTDDKYGEDLEDLHLYCYTCGEESKIPTPFDIDWD